MFFRWIISFILLGVPIGVTIGILRGIDLHREATGQEPLFGHSNGDGGGIIGGGSGGGISGGGGGTGNPKDNGITKSQLCQKSYGVQPPTKGQPYILNPNQWGWTESDGGGLCLNVTTFNNGSYATDTTAPEFSVTWSYTPGPETQPVRAFPNIMIGGDTLPIALQEVKSVNIDMRWTYGVGDEPAATTDATDLAQDSLNTNVAIDMFLDPEKENAGNSTLAKYEIMIWFAFFGSATQPIGLKQGSVTNTVLNGTTFDLYAGTNSLGQSVLTWTATPNPTDEFTGDISPLITKLYSMNKPGYPSESDYLGHFSLGSETFSATKNVTFYVPKLSIDIEK